MKQDMIRLHISLQNWLVIDNVVDWMKKCIKQGWIKTYKINNSIDNVIN